MGLFNDLIEKQKKIEENKKLIKEQFDNIPKNYQEDFKELDLSIGWHSIEDDTIIITDTLGYLYYQIEFKNGRFIKAIKEDTDEIDNSTMVIFDLLKDIDEASIIGKVNTLLIRVAKDKLFGDFRKKLRR
jgi:hypothetical protein